MGLVSWMTTELQELQGLRDRGSQGWLIALFMWYWQLSSPGFSKVEETDKTSVDIPSLCQGCKTLYCTYIFLHHPSSHPTKCQLIHTWESMIKTTTIIFYRPVTSFNCSSKVSCTLLKGAWTLCTQNETCIFHHVHMASSHYTLTAEIKQM